ncbi:UdgX family uracil-DNA binding protein [Tropicimonas sediminicola]|uniref:Type-4 uracil-DNA glycosylase n=1 Tax=Tropicimonas sediminicola TaxID=1031541 RepID=A0A239JAI3_9RHOB|nr:UdgX family uracil-DNA binding protein [Tropicimonas sediminicola]SNT02887.1 DNA polymerase [Tropicimonas sediminicola]
MYRVALPQLGFFETWRDSARRLLSHEVAPDQIVWDRGGVADLFASTPLPEAEGPAKVTATKELIRMAKSALCHTGPEAPALLYRALHRHQRDQRALANPADPLTRDLARLQKAVGRDIHKTHAFVRFRELPDEVPDEGAGDPPRRRFGAWFEPDHLILEAATPFFARRFADMDWTIATPQGVARFERGVVSFHPPAPRPDLPDDASEALWGTYFANIFNPARLHLRAMRSEMPLKYWKNLPETRLIPGMLEDAQARVDAMRAAMPTEPPARARRILDRLGQTDAPQPDVPADMDAAKLAAAACRRCNLCEAATQTVWGEGDTSAGLMIVGEQPGDTEDIAGRPFVGPAWQVLSALMAETGIGPVWKTNAVKHFKFQPRGKRRLHQSPDRSEIDHCRWWLDLERRFVKPQMTLALGATAAYALTGNPAPLGARRGKVETGRDGGPVLVTWHPSYLLRAKGPDAMRLRAQLRDDLATSVRMAVLPQ